MKSSPCLLCQLKEKDKNNPMCLQCVKRLDYVSDLEEELSFAMIYTETKPPSLRLPTYSKRAHLFSVVPERF